MAGPPKPLMLLVVLTVAHAFAPVSISEAEFDRILASGQFSLEPVTDEAFIGRMLQGIKKPPQPPPSPPASPTLPAGACTSSIYSPAQNQTCIHADGGTSCAAKEVYLTAARFESPVRVSDGQPLVRRACCFAGGNPGDENTAGGQGGCGLCRAGERLKGTLRLFIYSNPTRYQVGIWTAEAGSANCPSGGSKAACPGNRCQKTPFDPRQLRDLDSRTALGNQCCGDITPSRTAGVWNMTVPDYYMSCPALPAGATTCSGPAPLDWCMGWSQNAGSLLCSTCPTGVGATTSYVVTGPGSPAKCFCDVTMINNVQTYVPTCANPDPPTNNGNSGAYSCTSINGVNYDPIPAAIGPENIKGYPINHDRCCFVKNSPEVLLMVTSVNTTQPVLVGERVAVQLTALNVGAAQVTTPTVTYTLPAGLEFSSTATAGCTISADKLTLTCSLSSMATTSTVTRTRVIDCVVQATAGGTYTTNAVVASTTDTNANNNAVSIPINVATPLPPYNGYAEVLITAGPETVYVPVDTAVNYTFDVSTLANNTNPAENVVFVSTLPAGLTATAASCPGCTCTVTVQVVTCNVGSMAAGATTRVTITSVPSQANITYVPTGQVYSDNDYEEENNNAVQTVDAYAANLFAEVSITAAGFAQPLAVNQRSNYTLTVANAPGLQTATEVEVNSTVPAGLAIEDVTCEAAGCTCTVVANAIRCTAPALASGASFAIRVATRVLTAGTYELPSSVDATNDGLTTNNNAPLAPAVTDAGPTVADAAVAVVGPASPIAVGDDAVWSFAVSNEEPGTTAVNLAFGTTLPLGLDPTAVTCTVAGVPLAGCSCALPTAPSRVVSCTLPDRADSAPDVDISITTRAAADGPYSVTGTITSDNDGNAANNEATAPLAVTSADVAIGLVQDLGFLARGAPGAFALSITNTGDVIARDSFIYTDVPGGLTLSGPLSQAVTCSPALSPVACPCTFVPAPTPPANRLRCNVGDLAVGDSVTITVSVTAPSMPTSPSWPAFTGAASGSNDNTTNDATALSATMPSPCSPGYFWDGTACAACGYDHACVDEVRTACRIHEGTLTETSAACEVLECDACPDTMTDVIVTTGNGASPKNSLWWIKGWSAGAAATTNMTAEFICRLDFASTTMVADVAVTYRGDVLVSNTAGQLRYIPAAQFHARQIPGPLATSVCTTLPLTTLPTGHGWTGLSMGQRSDHLVASSPTGRVSSLKLVYGAGRLRASEVSFKTHNCDQTTTTFNSGGTDVTLGPDGRLYRYCSRDAATAFSASVFPLDENKELTAAAGAPLMSSYRASVTPQSDYRNAGAFCTADGAFGAGVNAVNSQGVFWRIGDTNDISGNAVSGTTPVNQLKKIPLHGWTAFAGTARLLINGAATQPRCGPQNRRTAHPLGTPADV